MKKPLLLILLQTAICAICVISVTSKISGQTTVCTGDTVLLVLSSYTGSIQWQESTDSVTWTAIPGATFDTAQVIVDTTTWYRAQVIDGTCLPVYADIEKFIINPVPAAPTASTHTPSLTQIIWNWNTIAGATAYYFNTVNNFGFATNNGASITYTQTGLTCNTPYTLYVWAYNSCGNSTATTLTQTTTTVTCPPTVNDIEGNTYNVVLIGCQCWTKENMRTTTYPGGGAPITKGLAAQGAAGWTVDNAWYSCPPNTANTGEDCAVTTVATLGLFYQWSAAMDGSIVEGAQGVCPTGWHIPTDAEWKTLEGFLGMTVAQQDLTGWRGTNEGSEMANHVTAQTWTAAALTGDAGFGTSGFDLGPSGYRWTDGNYYDRSNFTNLWSSTESGSNAWLRYLSHTGTKVNRAGFNKANGFSVRCVED